MMYRRQQRKQRAPEGSGRGKSVPLGKLFLEMMSLLNYIRQRDFIADKKKLRGVQETGVHLCVHCLQLRVHTLKLSLLFTIVRREGNFSKYILYDILDNDIVFRGCHILCSNYYLMELYCETLYVANEHRERDSEGMCNVYSTRMTMILCENGGRLFFAEQRTD